MALRKSIVVATTSQYDLPFFDAAHADLARGLADWTPQQQIDESDDRRACKDWVKLSRFMGAPESCGCAVIGRRDDARINIPSIFK